ncbi:hypothetical protein DNTS_014227 [Danionella cerebrum]|uniref:TERF1-interacting nuclear factor 2 N-terminal domain-containing protein n=1 Tax=Danionella cerebrum TaxID=2873325 RepID=A0A553MWD1_9TELE|nr:hypothetical protein DNTS_014227 [Danionella translucida]
MKTTINLKEEDDKPLPLSALSLIAPPVRLLSAAMWKVILQRDVVHYGKVEETVTSLCETLPGLLHYRHQARLTIGLRALMILEELRQSELPDAEQVIQELNKLETSTVPCGKRKDKKVEEAKQNFRTLVHSLLKNSTAREHFFKEEFALHYGKSYMASLEKLMWEFLYRLDQLLPVPNLAQTVSWLSAAPAVLEECARSATQPQLLRTLLQHENCLGHQDSSPLLPSTGDAVLSSLSLPLSGRVLPIIPSTSSKVTSPAPPMPRTTRRTARNAKSLVKPVFGSISDVHIQTICESNGSNSGQEDTSDSEPSGVTQRELNSCSTEQNKHGDRTYLGDVLVTVITQSSESDVDNNDERCKELESSSEEVNEPQRKNGREDKRPAVKQKGSGDSEVRTYPDKDEMTNLLVSCMKRQPRVVIPKLNYRDQALSVDVGPLAAEKNTRELSKSSRDRDLLVRKRKATDVSPTPEKKWTLAVNKLQISRFLAMYSTH